MTENELKALREKHAPEDGDPTNPCEFCWPTAYPCDVIKVLDATENLKPNDLKVEVKCDHAIALVLHGTDPVGINFTYCPKCGEKL